MDPCPFVKLIVESLALKLPLAKKQLGSGVYPSTTPFYCTIRFKNFPSQTAVIPLCSSSPADNSPPEHYAAGDGFHLDPAALRRLPGKAAMLSVSVYGGRMGRACGIGYGKLLGRVKVCVDANWSEARPILFRSGWMKLGSDPDKDVMKLHLTVRAELDPRFVFQFGGEPECSPVVFQIQGNIRQPVFSCKFSADRNPRSRPVVPDFSTNSSARGWRGLYSGKKDKPWRERKGWMVTIHDLSGCSIAAASMITPFVPSPGSDRVSRSNPGAWLILRPRDVSASSPWKPWGRLEAWRDDGAVDRLGYRFELVASFGLSSGVPVAQGTLSVRKGGEFHIDNPSKISGSASARGFVMSSSVEGEGKTGGPTVHVGVQHVTCMADAALFIALSAAIDLSMDACKLFSRKLGKEFSTEERDSRS